MGLLWYIGIHAYRERQGNNKTMNSSENETDHVHVEMARIPSFPSIYDEIEMYQCVGRIDEAIRPINAYTVLTRDPYGYNELYGVHRVPIAMNPPQHDDGSGPSVRSLRTWMSLPADLNKQNELVEYLMEKPDYVDMLPNRIEVRETEHKDICMNKGLSKSMNYVVCQSKNKSVNGPGLGK